MDPNANLEEMRSLAESIMEAWDQCDEATGAWQDIEEVADDGRRLAELVQALDGWIKGGGFMPEDWRRT